MSEIAGDFQHYEDREGTHIVATPPFGGPLHLLITRQTGRVGSSYRRAWFVIDGDVEPHPEAWFSWHYGYGRALERATRRALRHMRNYSVDRGGHGRR